MKSKILISSASAPTAIGPYSQAVRVGDTVFSSGQIPIDPVTGSLVTGGIREQTTMVLENLRAVLAAAGMTLNNIVKTTVYLADMKDFPTVNAIYGQFLEGEGTVFPARSTVQVSALPKGALIEIDCIARDF